MRVLFVTNRFPGPLTRGDQLRAYQHLRVLSRRHAITLLTFASAPDARVHADTAALCERVVVAPRNALGVAARAAAGLFGARPLQVAMHDAVPRSAGLPALLRDGRFDLAHVQLARLGRLVPALAPLPCVLDFVDALSVNMARRAHYDRGPLGRVAALEAARMARYERALCSAADATAVSSAADRAAIGNHPRLHEVCNGVDTAAFAFAARAADAPTLVFVGNLGYFPNVDAVHWFSADVLPRVRAQVPAARLELVGARPARSLRRLAVHQPGITLIGAVDDVRPHLARAAVAVVPLRAGSGQQLKLLEAMALGTPVVATSQSAAAIGARDGRHLLVADDGPATAAAIMRLLSDPAQAQALARAARQLIEQRYTWECSAAALECVWDAAVMRRQADTATP